MNSPKVTKGGKKSAGSKVTVESAQLIQVGRPLKYDPKFDRIVYGLALLGATLPEIASSLSVHVDTIHDWRKKFPRFSDALTQGREFADVKVAKSLYKSALGFEYDSEEIKVVSDGMGFGSSIERVPVKRYVKPDVTAQKFWLINRQPEKWRERIEVQPPSDGGIIVEYGE